LVSGLDVELQNQCSEDVFQAEPGRRKVDAVEIDLAVHPMERIHVQVALGPVLHRRRALVLTPEYPVLFVVRVV